MEAQRDLTCRPRDLEGKLLPFGEFVVDADNGIVYGKLGLPLQNRDRHGYIVIAAGRARKAKLGLPTYAHQAVWEAVNGPMPKGMTITHRNGIKDDNRLCNLEMITQSANMEHAYRTGLVDKVGVAHHMARLDDEKVLFIRANAEAFTDREFAEMFGVGKKTVTDARIGKNWSHLPGATRKGKRFTGEVKPSSKWAARRPNPASS